MLTCRHADRERHVEASNCISKTICWECADILCVCLSTPQPVTISVKVTCPSWKYSARRYPLLNKEILSCNFVSKDSMILECFKTFSCDWIWSYHQMFESAWRIWSRSVDYRNGYTSRNIASESPLKPRKISIALAMSIWQVFIKTLPLRWMSTPEWGVFDINGIIVECREYVEFLWWNILRVYSCMKYINIMSASIYEIFKP
jgi:hypothetical protein